MTYNQESFKKKLNNSGLHIEEVEGVPILKDGKGRIISGGGGSATWGSIGGQIDNQIDLKNKLAGKIGKLPLEPYSQSEYKFPFHFEEPVQNADNISARFHTLVMNDGVTRNQYDIILPSADVANDKAGLFTKAIYDEILSHTGGGYIEFTAYYNVGDGTLTGTVTQEQFDAIMAGGISKVDVKVGEDLVAVAICAPYIDKTHGGVANLFSVSYASASQSTADVAFMSIDSTLDVVGTVHRLGNSISLSDVPYSGGNLIKGMILNGTEYNFYSGVVGVTMNESPVEIEDGVANLGTVITEHQSLADYATTESMEMGLRTKQNKITHGTDDPTGGSDGDVYIKYTV